MSGSVCVMTYVSGSVYVRMYMSQCVYISIRCHESGTGDQRCHARVPLTYPKVKSFFVLLWPPYDKGPCISNDHTPTDANNFRMCFGC